MFRNRNGLAILSVLVVAGCATPSLVNQAATVVLADDPAAGRAPYALLAAPGQPAKGTRVVASSPCQMKSRSTHRVVPVSRHSQPGEAGRGRGKLCLFTHCPGQPQFVLTEAQLSENPPDAGFPADPAVPITEYNRPTALTVQRGGPVIYEAAFRKRC